MGEAFTPFSERVLSGRDRGLGARMLRAGLRAGEVVYGGIAKGRNALYERQVLRVERVGVPVVSVGNITVGGTGKTPVVRWLAERMRGAGFGPAVLLRGYKRGRSGVSDEAEMLRGMLGEGVVVHAEADRVAGAKRVMAEHPGVDLFILDDGFQHRRMGRDFDLVLIDAREPFGYGHVLPRGLLREPMEGLRRAGAFVLTHADEVSEQRRGQIELMLRSLNAAAPTYRTRHAHVGLRTGEGMEVGMEELGRRRFFVVAGIGRPAGLERPFAKFGAGYCGHRWFGDHHDYGEKDLAGVRVEAKATGADVIVVTEKDWVKMRRLRSVGEGVPIWRVEMRVVFEGKGEEGLVELMRTVIDKGKRN